VILVKKTGDEKERGGVKVFGLFLLEGNKATFGLVQSGARFSGEGLLLTRPLYCNSQPWKTSNFKKTCSGGKGTLGAE